MPTSLLVERSISNGIRSLPNPVAIANDPPINLARLAQLIASVDGDTSTSHLQITVGGLLQNDQMFMIGFHLRPVGLVVTTLDFDVNRSMNIRNPAIIT